MKATLLTHPAFILALALTLPSTGFAFADPAKLDTNSDGQVSAAELQAGLTSIFTKMDVNNDGFLSLVEVQAWRNSTQVEHFNTLDTDKSTTLSLVELQEEGAKGHRQISKSLFNLLDSDQNSTLSWEEFSVMEPSKGEMLRHFAGMDTDEDGQVSQAEFIAHKPGHHGHAPRAGQPTASGTSAK